MPSSEKSRAEQDASQNLTDHAWLPKLHKEEAQQVSESNKEQEQSQQRRQDGVGHQRWMTGRRSKVSTVFALGGAASFPLACGDAG